MTDYHLAEVNIARMHAPLEDPLMEGFVALLNEINALADRSPGFVWRSEFIRGRSQWFEKFDGPYMALWWVEAGHIPTVEEAKERLDHLRKHGESEFAFSFKRVYAPQAYESTHSR